MLRLLKYLRKKEWLLVLLALGCIVLQVGLELALPDYMHEITGLVEAPEPDMGEILATGRKMLLAALGSLAAALGSALLASRAAASFAARLRECIFDKILALDSDRITHFGVPGLVNRTANDVLQLQHATVLALEVLVRAPILVVWAVVKIGLQGQGGGLLITALGVLAMALLLLVCVGITVPKYRKMQQLTDDLGRITHENLKGLHTVRALEGERFEEERFERANEELTKTHLFTA
ncbi:MAG: ABC transporter ATP-binding protein, partial [Clostridia bacterium]|nr:ABC transporter ATP-binding protein [Clostridia bacterium]